MAIAVLTAGVCIVKVDTGAANALEELGRTVNGADSTKQAFWLDVPGDDNGGDAGPPIEIQFMGEIVRIRLEMSKWDTAIRNKVTSRLYGGTAGTPGTAGTLMFADSKTYRLLLHSTTDPRNFLRTIPRGDIEQNRGTKWSRLVSEWEAHKNASGVLYNSTTT